MPAQPPHRHTGQNCTVIDSFRRVVAKLTDSPDPDLALFAKGASAYLANAPEVRLDEALGLHPGWGQRGWWTAEAKVARDTVIEELDRQQFGQLSVQDAARGMLTLMRQHRDRSQEIPINARELLARLKLTGAAVPAHRQLVTIITAKRQEADREIRPVLSFHAMNFRGDRAITGSSEGSQDNDGPCRITAHR